MMMQNPTLTTAAEARFFGLDLRSLAREWRLAWADVLQSRWLSWLTPEAVVQLRQADGAASLWRGDQRLSSGAPARLPQFHAIEAEPGIVLVRSLTLPRMDAASTVNALALQAQSLSPFAVDDLVWGCRVRAEAQGQQSVDLVLASRQHLARYLQARSHAGDAPEPEVWAVLPEGAPVVLEGYGEGARRANARRGRWLRIGLIALALALLGAMAVTPTLQLRARAIQAVNAYDQLAREAAPAVHQREQLLRTADKIGTLSDILAGRIEPLRVLDRLTQVLPDDTSLQRLALKGNKVTISGVAGNASAIMQTLGQQPGVRDVRAPSPATRMGGPSSKENFVIEFTVDAQEYGVASAQVPPQATAGVKP